MKTCPECNSENIKVFDDDSFICLNPDCVLMYCETCGEKKSIIDDIYFCLNTECPERDYTDKEVKQWIYSQG